MSSQQGRQSGNQKLADNTAMHHSGTQNAAALLPAAEVYQSKQGPHAGTTGQHMVTKQAAAVAAAQTGPRLNFKRIRTLK